MGRKFEEYINIDKNKVALVTDTKTGEITTEYDVIEDTVGEDGVRIMKFKKTSRDSEVKTKRSELIDTLLVALGEKDSKAFSMLLENAIKSFGPDIIEDLHKKVVVDKKPVKARKGCFEIAIGKGISMYDTIPLR